MVALMKRLSLSAEDKERSAAVSEIVDLVKKGGVGALKVCPSLLSYDHPASRLLAPWERMLSLCVCLSSLCVSDCLHCVHCRQIQNLHTTPSLCSGEHFRLTCCASILAGWWSGRPPI